MNHKNSNSKNLVMVKQKSFYINTNNPKEISYDSPKEKNTSNWKWIVLGKFSTMPTINENQIFYQLENETTIFGYLSEFKSGTKLCSFKFDYDIYNKLKSNSDEKHMNMTDYIIQLILNDKNNEKIDNCILFQCSSTENIPNKPKLTYNKNGTLNIGGVDMFPEKPNVGDMIRLNNCKHPNSNFKLINPPKDGYYVYDGKEWISIVTWGNVNVEKKPLK